MRSQSTIAEESAAPRIEGAEASIIELSDEVLEQVSGGSPGAITID